MISSNDLSALSFSPYTAQPPPQCHATSLCHALLPHHALYPAWLPYNHGPVPCHANTRCQPPCHAMPTMLGHAIMPYPCHATTCTMPWHTHVNPCQFGSTLIQLDAIALSPALDQGRGRSRMSGLSSPSKQSPAHSSSHSHSPPRHCQRRYASPDRSSKDTNVQGRRSHNTGRKGKGRDTNSLFFQGGTVAHGTSACAICLGRHEHMYAKCAPSKLWNGEMSVCEGTSKGGSSASTASQFASASRFWQDARTLPIPHDTSVQDVESPGTALSNVLRYRKTEMLTPYKPSTWCSRLERHGLLGRYPNLHHSLMHGFDLGIPSISQTYIPANNPSIYKLPRDSTLPSPGYSMWNPWNGGWIPWNGGWIP